MKKIVVCVTLLAVFPAFNLCAQTVQNKDPKVVAQRLYQAWHMKDKKAALKVADGSAVAKLFGVKWRPLKLVSFRRREEGGFEAVYRDAKADWSVAMIVDGGISVGGYNVASVSFSTEE